jgi:5-deoxy-glucuronate isomerase
VYPLVERGRALKHLSFTVVELGGSLREHEFESGGAEMALDFYTGPVSVEIEGEFGRWSADIPERATLSEAGPMIFVPPGVKVRLRAANGGARITVSGAEGKAGGCPVLIQGDAIMRNPVGTGNFLRMVATHIAGNIPAARLICGETVSNPGCWTSCPPHKHDCFGPGEVPMEEIYYFRVQPKQGFGFIRVYTDKSDPDPLDNAYAVEDGDTVLIPRGYHPVVACPGYTLNYTWILAGEGRTYGAWTEDPKHSWIRNA